jgi:hypothetical protein
MGLHPVAPQVLPAVQTVAQQYPFDAHDPLRHWLLPLHCPPGAVFTTHWWAPLQ